MTGISTAVEFINAKPVFCVDGVPTNPLIYSLTQMPGGRWSWEELPQFCIQQFASIGFKLFQVHIYFHHIWNQDGSISIDLAQRQLRGVLDVCPDAVLFIRLHVTPPYWWILQNMQECTQYADGPLEVEDVSGLEVFGSHDLERVPRPSMASLKWRQESGQKIREFCGLLSATDEGSRVGAIHVASGVFHEWHYWGFIQHEPDISQPMTSAFRDWLARKYHDDEGLQKAWNQPDITLARVEVPGVQERRTTCAGIFRDPQREQKVIDYFECHHEVVADTLLHFCRAVKESWPRSIVTGVFYGYLYNLFDRSATGGHLSIQKVLESPFVDYMSAPQSYLKAHRRMGGTGQSRGLADAARLHGKLFLDEMDQATHADKMREGYTDQVTENLHDDIVIVRRNMVMPFTRGMGMWFYDFGPTNVCGWWSDPALLDEIRKSKEVLDRYYPQPCHSRSDVLFVVDAMVFARLASDGKSDPITESLCLNSASTAVYLSGAGVDFAYLFDLDRINLDAYRVVIFANCFCLTDRDRKLINKVRSKQRHLIWYYAPGFNNGSTLDVRHIIDVCQISVKAAEIALPADQIFNIDEAHVYRTTTDVPTAGEKSALPCFVVDDPQAIAVAWESRDRAVTVARKDGSEWVSWFCTLPLTDPKVLNAILRYCGVHTYQSEGGDLVQDGNGILLFHSATPGEKKLSLRNGKTIEFVAPKHCTALFDSTTGTRLL
ncbi:MAG: hypothetical protein RMN25_11650 [Anaerolineae bacterium]|nr:hypothetical protein [Thermoflexales bacterium]MDW8408423.1 hypothetical protein [Anaerolineae bacterium]